MAGSLIAALSVIVAMLKLHERCRVLVQEGYLC